VTRPRFQADNDLDQRIVVSNRRLDPAVDFQTASALGLHHLSDPEVLALAAPERRILVSHDRRTLPGHFREFVAASQRSPGLIVVSQRLPVGRAAELLSTFAD
jgi:predicted nuclease of predicted toxin-antitoxin system